MLYIALAASAILLFVVNLIAWRVEHPVRPILGWAISISLVMGLVANSFPILLQATLVFSCAATLVALGVPGYFAFRDTRHLQEVFPYVSMDDRLPQPKNQRPVEALPAVTMARLGEIETLIEDKDRTWPSWDRKPSLRQIHEDAVRVFVDFPTNGERSEKSVNSS